MSAIRPYGTWTSPIGARDAARGGLDLQRGSVLLDEHGAYWLEGRPTDGGRATLVRGDLRSGRIQDVTASPFHPRSRVHEYGGGDFLLANGCVYFVNDDDQCIYRIDPAGSTAPLAPANARRYADMAVDFRRQRLLCVGEEECTPEEEPRNVLLALDGRHGGAATVLAADWDFVAAPRISPDGTSLAWMTWNHPNMPWDGTHLWVASFDGDGRLHGRRCVAGSARESIAQPQWSPDGVLHFLSDRSGWWNLYRWRDARTESLLELDADFAEPQWTLAPSTYAFTSAQQIVCTYTREGAWNLEALDTMTLGRTPIRTPYTSISQVRARDGVVVFRGASATESTSIVCMEAGSGRCRVLRRARTDLSDRAYLSVPRAFCFSTAQGHTAHGLFYPPRNRDYAAPAKEKPPLLVTGHGGPTAAASAALDARVQFWTSRGFAYVDVDYRGSSGYGRAYREALYGQWGIADVEDCVAAALHLAEEGHADRRRLLIRGRSAGGFTALCALTFHDVFAAGASYYGISDLEALARDTHKFESHYTARLVGPYPERRDIYRSRSPIHFVDRLSCPVILLQGEEDRIVPPVQAEAMAAALRGKKIPVAHLTFAGEGHGFRRPETVRRTLEAELFFYSRVFGFTVSDRIEPVRIDNL